MGKKYDREDVRQEYPNTYGEALTYRVGELLKPAVDFVKGHGAGQAIKARKDRDKDAIDKMSR